MEDTTPSETTEQRLDTAEALFADGEFAVSLENAQSALSEASDGSVRMRLLFLIVKCSALLDLKEVSDCALRELDKLPEPEISRALMNIYVAYAEDELGRPQNALALHDINLATGLFDREDFRIHKYQLNLFKGLALIRLHRVTEALRCLDEAHGLYPTPESTRNEDELKIFRWVEPWLQVNRANCLLCLDRFEEGFQAANEVLRWTDGELATLARQHMAECRLGGARIQEALGIYADLKKRLPCRLVDEERIQTGITNCMNYLERRGAAAKPS